MSNNLKSVDVIHASKHPSIQAHASKHPSTESKTVLGKAAPSRVEVSQGLVLPGFYSNKQTNKQTNKYYRFIATKLAEADFIDCATTTQSISVYPLAKLGNDLQSVDEFPASKHPTKQTNKSCVYIRVYTYVHPYFSVWLLCDTMILNGVRHDYSRQ